MKSQMERKGMTPMTSKSDLQFKKTPGLTTKPSQEKQVESAELYDVDAVIYDLWQMEEKLKALALMFKNLDGGGSVIDHPEHLSGIGLFLKEMSQDLKSLISTQLDGREFQDTKLNLE